MTVWVGIGYGYHTQVVVTAGNLNAHSHRELILALQVVPLLQNHGIISSLKQGNMWALFTHDN